MGASVTNLREWRMELPTPGAVLLESRDHGPRSLGTTTGLLGLRRIEWFIEPPQVRSVVVADRPVRLAFPQLLFGVQRTRRGKFVALHVFATVSDPESDMLEDLMLWRMPLPNIIGHAAWVCFGDFNASIVKGDADPIESFWNSEFRFDRVTRWKDTALGKWADLTRVGLSVVPTDVDGATRDKFDHVIALAAIDPCMQWTHATPPTVLRRYLFEQHWVPLIAIAWLAFFLLTVCKILLTLLK